MNENKEPVYISVADASKKYGISRPYFYSLIKQGRLISIKDEKDNTLVNEDQVKEVSKSRKKKKSKKVKENKSEIGQLKGYVAPVKQDEDAQMMIMLIGVAIVGGAMGYLIANLLR